jgi:two-component system cell cycle sensor histidine kinase/response regulator CckA
MQHQGFITLETAVGEGTEFIIYFSLFEGQKAVEKEQSQLETLPQGNETILVVEDNLAMKFSLVDSLSELDYEVLTAESGKEALALLGDPNQDIDLVIADWLLLDMDGAILNSQIVQNYPETKLMIITGYPLDSGAGSDLLEKDSPWMSKPFDLATLAYKLRMVLGVRKEMDEGEED